MSLSPSQQASENDFMEKGWTETCLIALGPLMLICCCTGIVIAIVCCYKRRRDRRSNAARESLLQTAGHHQPLTNNADTTDAYYVQNDAYQAQTDAYNVEIAAGDTRTQISDNTPLLPTVNSASASDMYDGGAYYGRNANEVRRMEPGFIDNNPRSVTGGEQQSDDGGGRVFYGFPPPSSSEVNAAAHYDGDGFAADQAGSGAVRRHYGFPTDPSYGKSPADLPHVSSTVSVQEPVDVPPAEVGVGSACEAAVPPTPSSNSTTLQTLSTTSLNTPAPQLPMRTADADELPEQHQGPSHCTDNETKTAAPLPPPSATPVPMTRSEVARDEERRAAINISEAAAALMMKPYAVGEAKSAESKTPTPPVSSSSSLRTSAHRHHDSRSPFPQSAAMGSADEGDGELTATVIKSQLRSRTSDDQVKNTIRETHIIRESIQVAANDNDVGVEDYNQDGGADEDGDGADRDRDDAFQLPRDASSYTDETCGGDSERILFLERELDILRELKQLKQKKRNNKQQSTSSVSSPSSRQRERSNSDGDDNAHRSTATETSKSAAPLPPSSATPVPVTPSEIARDGERRAAINVSEAAAALMVKSQGPNFPHHLKEKQHNGPLYEPIGDNREVKTELSMTRTHLHSKLNAAPPTYSEGIAE